MGTTWSVALAWKRCFLAKTLVRLWVVFAVRGEGGDTSGVAEVNDGTIIQRMFDLLEGETPQDVHAGDLFVCMSALVGGSAVERLECE
jgi:hypothetical protein